MLLDVTLIVFCIKGAVMMGQNPHTITERVARYTYGVSFARKPFYEGIYHIRQIASWWSTYIIIFGNSTFMTINTT